MRIAALALAAGLAAGALTQNSASAQSVALPSTVRVVLSQSPGTTLDLITRIYAERLTVRLGVPFVVVNRLGAGGVIAAQDVALATPDGATIGAANSGQTFLGFLYKNLPFDPINDFAPLGIVGVAEAVVTVPASLGPRSLADFVNLARQKPGAINYNSAGIGTATHIAGAYFAQQAGIPLTNVSYKSGAEGIADMLAGRMESVFAPLAFTLSWVKEGKLLALAVGSSTPYTEPTPVPTAKSAGVDYEYSTWYGFLAPARTPKPLLDRYSAAIAEISKEPEVRALITAQGITTRVQSPDEMAGHIRAEITRLRPVLESIALADKN